MSYIAPVKDMMFNIQHLANLEQVAQMPGFEDAGLETAQAVLEECAKLTGGVIAPLNVEGDRNPSSWKDGVVTATPGFKEAYKQFADGGWQGLQHPADWGGQGLPKTIGAACGEMLNSANMSFALCPLLTDGAIEALLTAGSDELKTIYLEKLISGEWTGTMNLTEPQAGSDLAAVRTRAEPQPDGTYRVFGTKIFITWGEHNMADNIVLIPDNIQAPLCWPASWPVVRAGNVVHLPDLRSPLPAGDPEVPGNPEMNVPSPLPHNRALPRTAGGRSAEE